MNKFVYLLLFLVLPLGQAGNEPIEPFLPPLLKFENGTHVVDTAAWEERKVEVQDLLQNYILGTLPRTRGPKLLSLDVDSTLNF